MRSLIVVLSLLVVLSSGCEMFGKKKKAEQAAIELKAKNDSIATAKKKATALKLKKQKEAKAKKEAIRKAEEERKKLYKFHIIVGSFKTPKYATAYNDLMGSKGYQTELITNNYNFQLVSIGAFKSWREAVTELNKAREAIEPSSWIYIKN
jgi:cell division protein FtsN